LKEINRSIMARDAALGILMRAARGRGWSGQYSDLKYAMLPNLLPGVGASLSIPLGRDSDTRSKVVRRH
jgi:hypothetical protein